MMEKIQKFGGAMFTPVLLFAFAGVLKDLFGSLVIIAFAAVCAFASWRLNNG